MKKQWMEPKVENLLVNKTEASHGSRCCCGCGGGRPNRPNRPGRPNRS